MSEFFFYCTWIFSFHMKIGMFWISFNEREILNSSIFFCIVLAQSCNTHFLTAVRELLPGLWMLFVSKHRNIAMWSSCNAIHVARFKSDNFQSATAPMAQFSGFRKRPQAFTEKWETVNMTKTSWNIHIWMLVIFHSAEIFLETSLEVEFLCAS